MEREPEKPALPPRSGGPIVVGMTGSFGSGCSYIADEVLVGEREYKKVSLSSILKDLFRERDGRDPDTVPRADLQGFGDDIRRTEGPGYLAEKAMERIKGEPGQQKWVVDSIRNPGEIRVLRSLARECYVMGVSADRETRWQRVAEKYDWNRGAFDRDDHNDTGEKSEGYGQRVGDCFYEADIVISNEVHIIVFSNEEGQEMCGRVGRYLDLVEDPRNRSAPRTVDEAPMVMAYALSQRSSCLKRKVGAIIVDDRGNVISSGYNEVPNEEKPCEAQYSMCHRSRFRREIVEDLINEFDALVEREDDLHESLREHIKMLDYCRALHAEENAILNLTRSGRTVDLRDCTLYTTTYPCRLCAQKIAKLGIGRVVYLEPYPQPEAKTILNTAKVVDDLYEGVTHNGYFRLYGEQK